MLNEDCGVFTLTLPDVCQSMRSSPFLNSGSILIASSRHSYVSYFVQTCFRKSPCCKSLLGSHDGRLHMVSQSFLLSLAMRLTNKQNSAPESALRSAGIGRVSPRRNPTTGLQKRKTLDPRSGSGMTDKETTGTIRPVSARRGRPEPVLSLSKGAVPHGWRDDNGVRFIGKDVRPAAFGRRVPGPRI